MEHLTELENVLFADKLEVTRDENEHATGSGRLAIDGTDGVLTLLKRKAVKLSSDGLRALNLLAFEGQQR